MPLGGVVALERIEVFRLQIALRLFLFLVSLLGVGRLLGVRFFLGRFVVRLGLFILRIGRRIFLLVLFLCGVRLGLVGGSDLVISLGTLRSVRLFFRSRLLGLGLFGVGLLVFLLGFVLVIRSGLFGRSVGFLRVLLLGVGVRLLRVRVGLQVGGRFDARRRFGFDWLDGRFA